MYISILVHPMQEGYTDICTESDIQYCTREATDEKGTGQKTEKNAKSKIKRKKVKGRAKVTGLFKKKKDCAKRKRIVQKEKGLRKRSKLQIAKKEKKMKT